MNEQKPHPKPNEEKPTAGVHVKPSGEKDEQHARKSCSGADKPKRSDDRKGD